ncbi:hypothetical protein FA15DRAFT_220954 [Coprinopsis marcescibilis]|uniref:BBC1/AIM3 cysteine proteinase-fold domain-containing protein n=1 Tax=Coprinopsis marcescibilis TaxID=230819 RepID=A0A5C3L2T3_COPMA|nr:hypothetical protein FA15DRAFT_220954 [Coprinopsis marcescibilis]
MPSFADLKAKAAKTTSSGVDKMQGIKDRNTSVALKNTNWDPYSGKPPPPPPPSRVIAQNTHPEPTFLPPPRRAGSSASSSTATASFGHRPATALPPPALPSRKPSTGPPTLPKRSEQSNISVPLRAGGPAIPRSSVGAPGPPPPVAKSTKPVLSRQDSFYVEEDPVPTIDWTRLSQNDKDAFFGWLDEFFSKHLGKPVGPKSNSQQTQPMGNIRGAPPQRGTTKPTSWTSPVVGNATIDFADLSHPPAAIHDSSAADLAEFYKSTTKWNDLWYHQSGIPPSLKGNKHIRYLTSWQSRGTTKVTRIGVLFSDLSVFWGAVTYDMDDPGNERHIKREAQYLSRPSALDREELVQANETYGDTIASFAESFLGTDKYCGRGECWDLASEGLKHLDNYDYVPKPVPSISRTHGHLIYEGRASRKGKEILGRWRGGDDRVRRGDIVEWRRVRIATVGAPPGSYSTLGDPDHTAVIVCDTIPLTKVSNGSNIPPSELGTLTVVEQSVGQPPARREYNLRGLEEGEMWIYRPIALQAYLGIKELGPTPPDNLSSLRTFSG